MKLSEKVRIDKSPIEGNGCFSNTVFGAGDFIGTFEGYTPKRESKFVLYCANGSRRRGTNELRCLNHDDYPNANFKGYRLYAIKDIYPDDEITIHYGPMWTDADAIETLDHITHVVSKRYIDPIGSLEKIQRILDRVQL